MITFLKRSKKLSHEASFVFLSVFLLLILGITTNLLLSKNLSEVQAATKNSVYVRNGKIWMKNNYFTAGFSQAWGAAMTDLISNGVALVNNDNNTGREIQVNVFDGFQQYDNCSACTGVWGWNPVQAGDVYNHGSPVVAQTIGSNYFYTKTNALEWYPDNKGGGPTQPVVSNVVVEQWGYFVSNYPNVLKLHYKLNYLGSDLHGSAYQPIPLVYVNKEINNFHYYAGTSPWTNASITSFQMNSSNQLVNYGNLYASENWGNAANSSDVGVTLYVPGQLSYLTQVLSLPGTTGPTGSGANAFQAATGYYFSPGRNLEFDVYLVVDKLLNARKTIYSLHSSLPAVHPFDPAYSVDSPQRNATISGSINVSGWMFDIYPVSTIEVYLDGNDLGPATYGLARPDVSKVWPNAPTNIGFLYSLDTTKYTNGNHVISLKVITSDQKTVTLPSWPVTMSNP